MAAKPSTFQLLSISLPQTLSSSEIATALLPLYHQTVTARTSNGILAIQRLFLADRISSVEATKASIQYSLVMVASLTPAQLIQHSGIMHDLRSIVKVLKDSNLITPMQITVIIVMLATALPFEDIQNIVKDYHDFEEEKAAFKTILHLSTTLNYNVRELAYLSCLLGIPRVAMIRSFLQHDDSPGPILQSLSDPSRRAERALHELRADSSITDEMYSQTLIRLNFARAGKWLPPRTSDWLRATENDPAEAVLEAKLSELHKLNPTLARERIIAVLGVYRLDFETTRKFLARNNTSSLDDANDETNPFTASFNTLNVETRLPPDIHKDFSVLPLSADADNDPDSPDENYVRCLATAYLCTVKKCDEASPLSPGIGLRISPLDAFYEGSRLKVVKVEEMVYRLGLTFPSFEEWDYEYGSPLRAKYIELEWLVRGYDFFSHPKKGGAGVFWQKPTKYLCAALAAAGYDDQDTARVILDSYLDWTSAAAQAKSEGEIPLAEALGYKVVLKQEVVSEEE